MSMPTAEIDGNPMPGASTAMIEVEVIYAQAQSIWRQHLMLPALSTVRSALTHSSFFKDFPDCSPATLHVGIYGQKCSLDYQLKPNDRIEIYRPLVFDPMESRRRRAQHRQRKKEQPNSARIR